MALKKGVGMRLESKGVLAKFDRVGDRVEKHSIDTMRRYADEVEHLAKLNVPVEDFHVEDSITQTESRSGLNRRIQILVGVDADKLRALSGQEYDYSIWLHEGMYKLGKLSSLKDEISQAEDPRASVGPGYLERAIKAVRKDALRDLRNGIKGALK